MLTAGGGHRKPCAGVAALTRPAAGSPASAQDTSSPCRVHRMPASPSARPAPSNTARAASSAGGPRGVGAVAPFLHRALVPRVVPVVVVALLGPALATGQATSAQAAGA